MRHKSKHSCLGIIIHKPSPPTEFLSVQTRGPQHTVPVGLQGRAETRLKHTQQSGLRPPICHFGFKPLVTEITHK